MRACDLSPDQSELWIREAESEWVGEGPEARVADAGAEGGRGVMGVQGGEQVRGEGRGGCGEAGVTLALI